MQIQNNKTFKFFIYGLSKEGLHIEISDEIDSLESTKLVNSFLDNIEHYITGILNFKPSNLYIYIKVI